jgi:glycosyltransferase involved in cell wall biosynthesis
MKKNIWLWNHYATSMSINRGGRHYWFAGNLKKKGYEPLIFCANTFHNNREPIALNGNKYREDLVGEIPFIYVRTRPSRGNGIDRVLNMASFYKNLFPVARAIAKKYGKPDVIIASSVHPLTMVAGIQIARRLNVPCICEVRDLWPEAIFMFNKAKERSILGKILIAGEYWIYRNADALIFTKEGDIDYIKERKWDIGNGGKVDLGKCHYINNGVDLAAFMKAIKENVIDDEDLNADKFNVVYAGAIRPINNIGNILDAAALLKDEIDIQFLIYGDGTEREMLQKRVINESLTNVKMKGYINKQFIPYVLSKASVNILNYSQTQYNWARGNSSNKLFEYMASGKPIISTVKMGYCILDKYKCGLSLKNSTPQELAKAILQIKNMPKEQYDEMGRNAALGARDFDFSVLTNKLITVIESVCK